MNPKQHHSLGIIIQEYDPKSINITMIDGIAYIRISQTPEDEVYDFCILENGKYNEELVCSKQLV